MLKARKNLAVKKKHAYKARNSAAMKIQSWYRRQKARTECIQISASIAQNRVSEDVLTDSSETENSNYLQYDIDDEVAIALALVNQRPLSSLTENQREKVRQLRARVADNSSQSTKKDKEATRTTPTPKSVRNGQAKIPASSPVVAEKKEVIAKQPVETAITASKSQKMSKKREHISDQKTLTKPNKDEVLTNILSGTEPEAALLTKSEQHTNSVHNNDDTNTQCKKALKSKKLTQGVEQAIINTDEKIDNQQSSPQNEKKSIQDNSSRTVKATTKQKQAVVRSKQQTVPKSQLKLLQDGNKQIQKVSSNKKQEESNQPKSVALKQAKHLSFKQKNNFIQLKRQTPLQEVDSQISPILPLPMVTPILQYRETNDLKTDKKDPKLHHIEWEEPATPEEDFSLSFHHPNKIEEQPTTLLPSQDFREENKELNTDEKAHALINFAQELVIKDFLAWKRGPLNTMPSNGTHVTVQSESSDQQPTTQKEYEVSESSKSQVSPSSSVKYSPIDTPNDQPSTPHFAFVPDKIVMESLSLSPPAHRHNFVATHKPKLRGTRAWQSTNNVLPPRTIDTAVQTDSIDDFSLNSVVLLPPVSAKELQRPHNPGGHSRPEKRSKNDRQATKKDSSDSLILKKEKRLLHNYDKKPIKSLKSPSLNPIPRKTKGGYLNRYLHNDSLSVPLTTQSALGDYMEANHDQFMSWYNGYNYTAPPSILPENSPLQMNRSHQASYQTRRKLSSKSYETHPHKMYPRLKPMQQLSPSKMYQIGAPFDKALSDDPFQTLDSNYQYRYKKKQ